MQKRMIGWMGVVLALCCFGAEKKTETMAGKVVGLRCDSAVEPLGIDDLRPLLSWRLRDERWGAAQTAYRIRVASDEAHLTSQKADVWDTGRVQSAQSVNVPYAGPALAPEKRYYWTVEAWDRNGLPYSGSDTSWWETGLLTPSSWTAQWIGYEQPEHRRIRESGAAWISNGPVSGFKSAGNTEHDFRFHFELNKPATRAVLYATGQDSAAAWINGRSVRAADPLPPWQQSPWKSYTSTEITRELHSGGNLLAVGVTHYAVPGANSPMDSQSPMSACLYIELADGSVTLLTSGSSGWRAALNPSGNWFLPDFDESSWAAAEEFKPKPGIGNDVLGRPWPTGPVVLLRHAFELSQPVVSARLYATALGAYKFHLNGNIVGDQVLSPGWMDFREHVPYQVYDVTAQLSSGRNALSAYLAPGWYTTPLLWFRQGYNYGNTPPALKAQLRLQHADGSVEWINTGDSWKADFSPISTAEIYDGETYDARKLQAGWDTAAFPDNKWQHATLVTPVEPQIIAQDFPPIREEKVLTANAITSPAPGVYIYDFGQNLAGVPRVKVQGASGTDVRLRFAEVLNPDGTMYVENLRTAKATDHFILAGQGLETYQPQFTFHGFRYLEVTGLNAKPALDAIQAVVLHTAAPFTAELKTGDAMVNQLWSNVLWGQRSNFVGLPTDCPQRDERLGWTADAQVFWRTATYNMDLTNFTLKFSADLRGTQVGTPMFGIFAPGTTSSSPGFAAGWSDAGIIIPWTGWIQSSDKRIIDRNWAAMEKYLAAIQQANPDYLWRNNFGIPFGDWLTPTQTTPEDLVATAYWAYDVSLMKDMASALGRASDASKYADVFQHIKAAFNRAYVRPDGFVGTVDRYPSIPPPTATPLSPAEKAMNAPVETQTGYVLALHMNLIPADLRTAAANRLVKKIQEDKWLLGTGFLGTPYLLEVLSDTGHSDIAYRLLLNKDYPSWGYLIDHGATTTWERWNGDKMRSDPSMNSYNHYAYGAVAEWIYRYAAGIDTVSEDAGFHTVYLHPNFDSRLGSLDFSYQSPYGKIASQWTVTGSEILWTVTIPPNTNGRLPLSKAAAASYTLDGVPLARSRKLHTLSADLYQLPAGTYSFKLKHE